MNNTQEIGLFFVLYSHSFQTDWKLVLKHILGSEYCICGRGGVGWIPLTIPPPWLSIDCCVKEGMPVRQLVPTPPHHQTDMWPSMWLLSGRRNQRGGWGKVNLGVVTIALIFLLLRWKVTQFKKDIYIDTGTILS